MDEPNLTFLKWKRDKRKKKKTEKEENMN